jgi:C-8 sterol isomerase
MADQSQTHTAPTPVSFDDVSLAHLTFNKTFRVARGAGGSGNASRVIGAVIASVRAAYPQHTLPHDEWMFNNAGGAMGAMTVLHASFSECGGPGHGARALVE